MAYVALSCVRSVSGVYLTAFNSESIKISISCLKEVNRPRQTYRKDLPIFSKKRKLISRDECEGSTRLHTNNCRVAIVERFVVSQIHNLVP